VKRIQSKARSLCAISLIWCHILAEFRLSRSDSTTSKAGRLAFHFKVLWPPRGAKARPLMESS
jgi:hypothetical protein